MLEFAIFKQNAMQLSRKLSRSYSQSLGCMGFFSALIPSTTSLEDSLTIGMLASSLNEENDDRILNYMRSFTKNARLSIKEYENFKSKVLAGLYLVMWSHYNSTVLTYLNKTFIEYLLQDLGVDSIEDMDDDLYDSCLHSFSYYCSFIYQNRQERGYADLNSRLGITIQADIETARNIRYIKDDSWYSSYGSLFCSLWITNKS